MAAASSNAAADALKPRSPDARHRLQGPRAGARRSIKGDAPKLATPADRSGKDGNEAPAPSISLKHGTRLIREWRGVTHSVIVQRGGFEWRGQTYASLTLIAQEITGAHWSGPRFFGLTKRRVSATQPLAAEHVQK